MTENIMSDISRGFNEGLLNYYKKTKNRFISKAKLDQIMSEVLGYPDETVKDPIDELCLGYILDVLYDKDGKVESVGISAFPIVK